MDMSSALRAGTYLIDASKPRKHVSFPRKSLPALPCRVACKASSAEDASNAARQARFLQEIDKLAEARRLESTRRRSNVSPAVSQQTSEPIPQPNRAAVPQQQTGARDQPGLSAAVQRVQRSPAPSKSNADSDASAARQTDRRFVRVKFVLHLHIEYGQRIKVVGSDLMLGGWSLQHAPELAWSEGDRWHVSVDLPSNGIYEYKYVIVGADGQTPVSWQRGNNSVLAIKPDDDRVEVYDNWDGQPGAAVIANGQSATRETRLQTWASQLDAVAGSQRAELRRTRMELAAAQEDARGARADVSRLKAALARSQTDMLTAERKIRELERTNQLLRAQLAESSLTFHKAFETAQRLLSKERQWLPTADEDATNPANSLTLTPTPGPSSTLSPRRAEPTLSPAVDMNDSLEFLSMLGRSQFAVRGRKLQNQEDVTDGLTDVDAAVEHDDVAARAAEEVAATAALAPAASRMTDVVEEVEEAAASEDAQEAAQQRAELPEMSPEAELPHVAPHGRGHRDSSDGISARGRASVSAVQGFIARIRQGLGVRPAEPQTTDSSPAPATTDAGAMPTPARAVVENSGNMLQAADAAADTEAEVAEQEDHSGTEDAVDGQADDSDDGAATCSVDTDAAMEALVEVAEAAAVAPVANGAGNAGSGALGAGAGTAGPSNGQSSGPGLVISSSTGEAVLISRPDHSATSVHAK